VCEVELHRGGIAHLWWLAVSGKWARRVSLPASVTFQWPGPGETRLTVADSGPLPGGLMRMAVAQAASVAGPGGGQADSGRGAADQHFAGAVDADRNHVVVAEELGDGGVGGLPDDRCRWPLWHRLDACPVVFGDDEHARALTHGLDDRACEAEDSRLVRRAVADGKGPCSFWQPVQHAT
jgi:hypothetical protein